MSSALVSCTVDQTVAVITLNRPEKLNAINPEIISGLHKAMDEAERDEAVRAIVLTGEGRAFSAGFDLNAEDDADWSDTTYVRQELQRDFDVIMRFWNSQKPTIAAVHGYCLGGAMEMAIACDITIAASGTRFGAPEAKIGSGIVALLLPWMIGPKQAKELLFTGDDRVTAERALALGLINRITDDLHYLDESMNLARTIAGNDPVSVRLTKMAINRSLDIAGMSDALTQALEIDVEIETSELKGDK